MKHAPTLLLAIFAAAVTAWLVSPTTPSSSTTETAFERVMRTGTLRCGYVVLPPELSKDPNTGDISGPAADIISAAAQILNWKVEWVQEAYFPSIPDDLANQRYDMMCFTQYRYAPSAARMDYTTPVFYSSTGAFVRAGDTRLDNNLPAANNPQVTIATVDGEMSMYIAAEDYPQAKTISMPQTIDLSVMMQNVVDGKADITFAQMSVATKYMQANPGKIRQVPLQTPVRVFAHGFGTAKGEYDLTKTMDIVLNQLENHGIIRKILTRYDPTGHVLIPLAKPYQ